MERLKSMSDVEIQEWLRLVEPTALAVALGDQPEEIAERVYVNMSQRASAAMRNMVEQFRGLDASALRAGLAAGLMRKA